MEFTVRDLEGSDQPRWTELFQQYCDFYAIPASDRRPATVFSWLLDPDHICEGRGLVVAGRLSGFAHVRSMPLTLTGGVGGFLDDLFVDPAVRGGGGGRALLDDVIETGRRRGWAGIQWLTGDDNYRARSLYDRVAVRTHWITYEVDLPD